MYLSEIRLREVELRLHTVAWSPRWVVTAHQCPSHDAEQKKDLDFSDFLRYFKSLNKIGPKIYKASSILPLFKLRDFIIGYVLCKGNIKRRQQNTSMEIKDGNWVLFKISYISTPNRLDST